MNIIEQLDELNTKVKQSYCDHTDYEQFDTNHYQCVDCGKDITAEIISDSVDEDVAQ